MTIEQLDDAEIKALSLFFDGCFTSYLHNNPHDALSFFDGCLSMEHVVAYEHWLIPYCRYEMAHCRIRCNHPHDAMPELDNILNGYRSPLSIQVLGASTPFQCKYAKYEFSDHLKRRATLLLAQLQAPL
jgi:hypothetical protein